MATTTNGRVIVGVDDSLAGLRSLRFAAAEARRRHAVLHAIRAWPVGTPTPGGSEALLQQALRQAAAKTLVDAFDAAMGGAPPDLEIQALVVGGDAAHVLVDHADQDDDLLVVGRSQRPWWHRPFTRSTSRHCATHASCPVVVVPPDAFAREATRGRLARTLRRDLTSLTDVTTSG